MRDDKTDNTIVGVSDPSISRLCPVIGWWTMIQLLARRAGESNAFSVPDRNTLWITAEDGLLVQTVVKYSTSDVLGHDWSEVASELPGTLSNSEKSVTGLVILWWNRHLYLSVSFFLDPLPSDPRSCSQKLQTQRILHDLFTIVHLMCPHPPPLRPCPQPPHSHKYTGTSVLTTQPGRRCLPLRN
jgi:hypothetical protein